MPSFDNLIGKQIDDFVIEERLGQGAMATVYRAFQPSINRHVALKVIRLDDGMGQQDDFRRRFALEAEVIASLEHIHILPIYAYGINDTMAYLAIRWLRGGTLSELLRREPLSLDRTADIFKQVAQGLSYAHAKGIIHRDLKPSNIMLDDTGNAYLTDFGLAKLTESGTEITKSGTIVGTPAYMSPEQLRGEPLDHRSDIYSLGVILYNMAAGRLPFETGTSDLVSMIYQHLEKEPIPPSEINPDISQEVEAVILRALSKDRDDRFDSADDMARALNRALGRSSSESMLVPPSRPSTRTRPRQKKRADTNNLLWLVTGIVALFAVILAGVFFLYQVTLNNQQAATQTAQAAAQIQTATAAGWTPTPPPQAIIIKDSHEPSSKVVPSQAEIALAKTHLGNSAFIAYFPCSLTTEYHAGLAREMSDLAATYGIPFKVYDGEGESYKQLTKIDQSRTEGAAALIICPLDIKSQEESLVAAQKAKIPLVLFADNISSYGGVLVGGDNYLIGFEPGRFAGKVINEEKGGKAKVIILDFAERPDIVARANGLEDGVLDVAPQAKIIGRYRGGTPEFAKESVSKLLKDGVQFDVILSINDGGSYGAIQAMEEAGIDPKSVIISSVDAEAKAKQYILKDYFMRGSLQSSRTETAKGLLNSAVMLLAGATVPEYVLVPPGPMVTKETLQQALTATPAS
jgi:serine/threonine protein kinase/DNA-binding LacI/PurR family transcriptional regulator